MPFPGSKYNPKIIYIMNKKPVKMQPVGAKPTPEQLEEQAKRAFIQKRNSIAEGILYNAIQGRGFDDLKGIAEAAVDAADAFMAKCYSVSIKGQE